MTDILDVLHARCAEFAAKAILTGEQHPMFSLTTSEAADLLGRMEDLRKRYEDMDLAYRDLEDRNAVLRRATSEASVSLERIRTALEQRSAHPEALARQAATIARCAAQHLAEADLPSQT
ncbi:hypothetical protein [Nocardia sp. NBC_00511]|uniref:hypothetical protein n=1 Tax=Nocardia sp. NBC_00511 TaxID=2903591 RepID=UPI0030E2201E